jgi:5,10-methylenetetrahydromethanopterin reductase
MADLRQLPSSAFTIRDLPWAEVATIAREGEALGYDAAFLPETGTRDTLATLVGIAAETETLGLGTGVIPMRARTSKLAAMAAATVQERSGGRLVLGVGTGGSFPGALDQLRMYVGELREHLESSPLSVDSRAPIWIAALGSRAVRLAGEIADGVILNWCTPDRVAEARDAIRSSAQAAGRDPDAVTIAVYVRAAFSDRADEALHAAAAEYSSYPSYARQFEAMGIEPTAEAVVEAICLRGEPGEARKRLEEYRVAGADLPVVYPVLAPGETAAASIATLNPLAPEVA